MNKISLKVANQIIEATLQTARDKNMPPIAVVVLDETAHLKAMQREDGVSFLRADIAQAKAWGAMAMGSHSEQIAERYLKDEQQRGFITALNSMTGGRLIPLPGGVLVRDRDGEVIGAVGAAGGDSRDDEACVHSGIAASGLSLT